MGMNQPETGGTLEKFSETIGEGVPFILEGIRVVDATSEEYGKGEMVIVKVAGHAVEQGIWGAYLVAQARSVEAKDLGQEYTLERRVIPDFSKRPVKVFWPTDHSREF